MKTSVWTTLTKHVVVVAVVAVVTMLAVRVYDAEQGPPLELWHTYVPHEYRASELDTKNWDDYLRREDELFVAVRKNVTDRLTPDARLSNNRYVEQSTTYAEHFKQDWNRSFVLEPAGAPKGVAVLLHGLTDSPYSVRHLALQYQSAGFVAIAIRLPGHGTVPAGLNEVEWEDWLAATRLAVREARRRVGPDLPLHIAGYSNGAALAMMYTLAALEDNKLARPDQLVLISPLVGVTRFARFAGLAALPALLPGFAKSEWLSIVPEFNPFKYNSFPVNGARQSFQVTQALQAELTRQADNGSLSKLPPVLTFQSALDFTVSARAIMTAMYALFPNNGSEVVMFDLNRAADLTPFISEASDVALTNLLPPGPRNYRTTIITNAAPDTGNMVERSTDAGKTDEQVRDVNLSYPEEVYSLSHVALPFPVTDGLYGTQPDPKEDFGIRLGRKSMRGEVGVLVVSLDSLLRMTSNPFYPYMQERIEQVIHRTK